ncbi:putative 3-hydroxyisobutyrate dehydrogenase [Rhodovastum atsumiense]|uniref:3-hydroxyisobutyrate dehydrogenase n=1 Tax=Rhodovastum atsumiense TaxID=504468 RepID=A0A5M6IQ72_9PROT|nr:3-hydroxyisobutyrate dehydrogenase [Rhodovastum atsumiense]CAH2604477.1 putative 3-hydroxyisobutyrate dehydrogenase [Rhodovastum atsumiense]
MRIAFIGLGNMGQPMAANLVRAGHDVAGCDIAAANVEKHVAQGGRAAATIEAAVDGAEAVITMLPAGRHVAEVVPRVLRAAVGSPLLIDSSTIDVATTREMARQAQARGIEILDAPVSGGVRGAIAGTLTFMVGGGEAAFARGRTLLQAMGKTVVHTGGPGAGQAAKICNNMILGISMIAVSEAFVLADRLGLDRQKLFEVASTSSGQCWALTSYCPVPGPVPSSPANSGYLPGFAVPLMLKDLALAQEAAEAGGAATPLGAHAARIYAALMEAGYGDRDFSVTYEYLAELMRADAP